MQVHRVQAGAERQSGADQPPVQFHLVAADEQPKIRYPNGFHGRRPEQGPVEQRGDAGQKVTEPATSFSRSSETWRRQTNPRRSGNASRCGSARSHTIGDTSASPWRAAQSSSVPSTSGPCGRPSSSASQIQSAPAASECNIPSAKPPAPPRFRIDPRYVVGIGWPATRSRTASSWSLSTTIRWSGRRCWDTTASRDLASS